MGLFARPVVSYAVLLGVICYLLFVIFIPIFAGAASVIPCTGTEVSLPAGETRSADAPANRRCTFADYVTLGNNIINFLLFKFAAPFATLLFMWAGFLFMFKSSSAGDISKAKGIFWNVTIGFVVALAAVLIIKVILAGLMVGASYSSSVLR